MKVKSAKRLKYKMGKFTSKLEYLFNSCLKESVGG